MKATRTYPTLTALVLIPACLALAWCRGKHEPPPGFVPPEDLEGYALLMVRLEDGAWVQQSPMADIERLHVIEELPWLFLQASEKEGSGALELVESLGFELECRGAEACGMDEGQEMPEARINAVRLVRIMRDAVSGEKSLLGENEDASFVNLVGRDEADLGSEKGSLCHGLFPSRVDEQWLVGWIPCDEAEYVMVLHGSGAKAKALKIVDFLEL